MVVCGGNPLRAGRWWSTAVLANTSRDAHLHLEFRNCELAEPAWKPLQPQDTIIAWPCSPCHRTHCTSKALCMLPSAQGHAFGVRDAVTKDRMVLDLLMAIFGTILGQLKVRACPLNGRSLLQHSLAKRP